MPKPQTRSCSARPAAKSRRSPSRDPQRDLLLAIEIDDPRLARAALRDGAKLDAERDGMTPLRLACEIGSFHCAAALVRRQEARKLGPYGTTPLLAAALMASEADQAPEAALECGRAVLPHSDPNEQGDHPGQTALALAARANHAPLVRLLCSATDPKIRDPDGLDALQTAAFHGSALACEALLSEGFPIQPHGQGFDALCWAAKMGHKECVEALLPFIDPNARSDGRGAADLARHFRHDEVADLIEAHALARRERAALSDASTPASGSQSEPRKPLRV